MIKAEDVCTGVQNRRPVPDVHGGRGLLRAQQLADDGRRHDAGRVADLQRGGRHVGCVFSGDVASARALMEAAANLDDHLDGGQRGGDVLGVRRPHRDGNAAGVQAAVERRDQVDACRRNREEKPEEMKLEITIILLLFTN